MALDFYYHKPMNRYIFPIIAVAVLVFALVSLNHGMSTNAQPDNDDDDQQQSQQDKKADTAKNTPPTPTAPGQASPAPPDELTVNDPSKAKYHVVAGWNYDSTNQTNQAQLNSTLSELQEMAKNSHGAVSLQIVDVDVPDDSRSPAARGIHDLGVSINGRQVTNDNLGEGTSNTQTIARAFAATAH
jgi:hypothetical protein